MQKIATQTILSALLIAGSAYAKTADYSKIWLSGLQYLAEENQRSDYIKLRSELIRDPQLCQSSYRELLEAEIERKVRADLHGLGFELAKTLCQNPKSQTCKDFMDLWKKGVAPLLFFESSPQKLHAADGFLASKNCREATSVLREVEKAEGRNIQILERLKRLETCNGNAEAVLSIEEEMKGLRELIRAE